MEGASRSFVFSTLTLLLSIALTLYTIETDDFNDSALLLLTGTFIGVVPLDLFSYFNTPLHLLILSFATILLSAGTLAIGWSQPEGIELRTISYLLIYPCIGLMLGSYRAFKPTWQYVTAVPILLMISQPFVTASDFSYLHQTFGICLLPLSLLCIVVLVDQSRRLTWVPPGFVALQVSPTRRKVALFLESLASASLLTTFLYTLPRQETLANIECLQGGVLVGLVIHSLLLKNKGWFNLVTLSSLGGLYAYSLKTQDSLLESCFISLFIGLGVAPALTFDSAICPLLTLCLSGFIKLYTSQQAELIHLMAVSSIGLVSSLF